MDSGKTASRLAMMPCLPRQLRNSECIHDNLPINSVDRFKCVPALHGRAAGGCVCKINSARNAADSLRGMLDIVDRIKRDCLHVAENIGTKLSPKIDSKVWCAPAHGKRLDESASEIVSAQSAQTASTSSFSLSDRVSDFFDDSQVVREIFDQLLTNGKETLQLNVLLDSLVQKINLDHGFADLLVAKIIENKSLCHSPTTFQEQVTFEEFAKAFICAQDESHIRKMFNEMDMDSDGVISGDDLKAFFVKHGGSIELNQMVEKMAARNSAHSLQSESRGITLNDFRENFSDVSHIRMRRQQFVRSLGLDAKLASLLKAGSIFDGLQGLREMSDEEMKNHISDICIKFHVLLPVLLEDGIKKLRSSGDCAVKLSEHNVNSKFTMSDAFVGTFATLDDFYNGPEARIGVPNPRIREGMEQEHCRRANAKILFRTPNYNLRTFPAQEWEFVVCPQTSAHYPHTPKSKSLWPADEDWLGDEGRDIVPLGELLGRPEVRHEVEKAGLLVEEVIAARLYTGPMFVLYNAVLRGFPETDVAFLCGNRYETTIFTIASAVVKLSKVTDVPQNRVLYRGLGGMILPAQFWRSFPECVVILLIRISQSPGNIDVIRDVIRSAAVRGADGCSYIHVSHRAMSSSSFRRPKPATRFRQVPTEPDVVHGMGDRATEWTKVSRIRIVSEGTAAEHGDGLRLTIALPLPKLRFRTEEQRALLSFIRGCVGSAVSETDILIESVSDKPADFRGGGLPALPSPFPRPCRACIL